MRLEGDCRVRSDAGIGWRPGLHGRQNMRFRLHPKAFVPMISGVKPEFRGVTETYEESNDRVA